MPVTIVLRVAAVGAILLASDRSDALAQSTLLSQRLEPSASLRPASERPPAHEGSSVASGDTLLEVAIRLRLRYASLFVALEGSTVPEWFDPQLVGSAYLQRGAILPHLLFAPAGPRKLSIRLERSF